MELSKQTASHFRQVFFGGNWASVNLQNTLADVSFDEASRQIPTFNTIAMLVFHINYYVSEVMKVLEGGPLDAHDSLSFSLPTLQTEADWENLRNKTLANAEKFATLVEQIPGTQLWEYFNQEKYGTYYRNLHGIIEHTHYHLGQIVILKKMLRSAT